MDECEIVSEEAYAGADIDFNVQINNLIAQSPEAIFVPDYYGKVALILDQVPRSRLVKARCWAATAGTVS